MPNIPVIQAQRSALNSVPSVDVSPNAFGASIGAAAAALGEQMQRSADVFAGIQSEEQRRAKNEELANANSKFMLAPIEANIKETMLPDGSDFDTRMETEGSNAIEEFADQNIKDPEVRKAFVTQQTDRLRQRRESGALSVAAEREQRSKMLATDTINGLINKVSIDASEYDTALADMNRAIDGRPMSQREREIMKIDARSELIVGRFSGLLAQVRDAAGYDALRKELQDPKWSGDLKPSQFDVLMRNIDASQKAFVSGQDAKARGMLDSMEARSRDRIVVPEAEMRELGQLARDSGSAAVQTRYAQLYDQQALLKTYGRSPPAVLQDEVQRQEQDFANTGDVGRWAQDASNLTGGLVPASYLLNKLGREYSEADIAAGRYNEPNKAGASSARGLYQFVDDTWLGMVKGNASVLGVNLFEDGRPLSDAQILAMRGDPALNTKVAALYARDNYKHIYGTLGIRPGPTELYIAHFLGPAGAVSFLTTAQNNPDMAITAVGSFSQRQIDANRGVFYNKDGSVKTFRQVYENIASSFNGEKSEIVANRIAFMRSMLDAKQKAVADDPMSEGARDGLYAPYPLETADDWSRLGRDAASVAKYYNIPMSDMAPLSKEHFEEVTRAIKDGSADDVLALMTNMQSMGGDMARAAYRQIGKTEPEFEYAAGLAAEAGGASTATDIIRGAKRMQEDKSIKDAIGANDADLSAAFLTTTGAALNSVSPRVRDQIFRSAVAHYVERNTARGDLQFTADKFAVSVNAVLGGEGTVDKVNGEPTVLPKGLSADDFDTALNYLTVEDYARMSVDGKPPRYMDGSVADPDDIALEGKFRAIGANSYYIEMATGFLLNGVVDGKGRAQRYIFEANPNIIKGIVQRYTVGGRPDVQDAIAETPENADMIRQIQQAPMPGGAQ